MRLNCVMLTLYNNVWKNLFGNTFINLGIRGDRVENIYDVLQLLLHDLKMLSYFVVRIMKIKDCFPLFHFLETGSIILTHLFVDFVPAMNVFLLIESLSMK